VTNADGSTTTTVTSAATGETTSTTTSASGVTGTTVTDASGAVTSVSANIPASALESGSTVTLPVTAEVGASAPVVTVTVPANTTAKVEIPTATTVSYGTVAVLVDEDGNETIIKDTIMTEDGVLVTLDGSATIKLVDKSKDFSDVADGQYFSDAIDFVSSRGIMNGTGGDGFEPTALLQRSQLAQMLYNLEGQTGGSTASAFSDVADGMWYTDAINWAYGIGIVNGNGDGTFSPTGNITREAVVTMLYRYAQTKGYDVSTRGDLSSFTDADQVSSWATEQFQWAVGIGLIQGDGTGILNPGGNAQRLQIAIMIERFFNNWIASQIA
jgi:hypothetical protein